MLKTEGLRIRELASIIVFYHHIRPVIDCCLLSLCANMKTSFKN